MGTFSFSRSCPNNAGCLLAIYQPTQGRAKSVQVRGKAEMVGEGLWLGGEGVPSSLQLFVEGCAVAGEVRPGAQRVVAEAEGAGSQCTVAPCSPDLLVSTAGFTGLEGRLLSTLPRGHYHRQSKDTYSPQPWPRGLPCHAQGRQFFLKREVPFTKK